jgi:hypothetical protein
MRRIWSEMAALWTSPVGILVVNWPSICPALARMRELTRRAATLVKAQKQTGVDMISQDVQSLLGDLAQSVIRTRVDFIHYPLIYYFHADTEGTSLADSLRQLAHLAERA